ncbi:MAG: RidA family protein [Buchnera aphidicola (Eriosoma harunire)]
MLSIFTKKAPKPLGPYSQAIHIDNFIITSGQIPIHTECNSVPKNIIDQTYLTLNHIKFILIAGGFEIKHIIKMTIFITNINNIDTINQAYKKFFMDNNVLLLPARSCVEVSRLPKEVNIEIEAIAYKKK